MEAPNKDFLRLIQVQRVLRGDFEIAAEGREVFKPRKAEPRTFQQWAQFFLFRLGISKPDHKSSYSCPICGEFSAEEATLLSVGQYHHNDYYAYEFGVDGGDWIEEHQCERCGTVYEFQNSSC